MTITLINGDATDFTMYPSFQSVDLILMDPPYFPKKVQYQQRNRHKNKNTGEWEPARFQLESIPTPTPSEYPGFWSAVLYECIKCLKSSGWFIFKADDITFGELYAQTKTTFDFFKKIIWDKKMPGIGTIVRNTHENLAIFRPYDHKETYCLDPTNMGSIIRAANFNRGRFGKTRQQDHINQTPTEVWKPIIEQFCPPTGMILDPFMGSGSIGKAIRELNRRKGVCRKYWGIELMPRFYQLAKRDLDPHTILTSFICSNGG